MSVWDQFNGIPSKMELFLIAMASWRVAVFLVRESGPWGIMRHIRELTGIDHDPEGRPLPSFGGRFASFFSCIWCMSFWTAIIMYVVAVWADLIVTVLALWGIVAAIETMITYVVMMSFRDDQ